MEREMNSQVEVIASKSSKILNRTIKEREKKCNICESDVRPSLQLHKRINELERQLKDLSEELKEY
jgi:polyhydroxyalkanoate synthesis regulator phasin